MIVRTADYLESNPLSVLWRRESMAMMARRKPYALPAYVLAYAGGMAGYAISLPGRVLNVAIEILRTLWVFVTSLRATHVEFKHNMGNCAIRLAKVTSSLGAGLVGLVCPPLAYKIEEAIESNPTLHRQSYFMHNRWHGEVEALRAHRAADQQGQGIGVDDFVNRIAQQLEAHGVNNELNNRVQQAVQDYAAERPHYQAVIAQFQPNPQNPDLVMSAACRAHVRDQIEGLVGGPELVAHAAIIRMVAAIPALKTAWQAYQAATPGVADHERQNKAIYELIAEDMEGCPDLDSMERFPVGDERAAAVTFIQAAKGYVNINGADRGRINAVYEACT